jgi:transmembrane sensor
MRRAAKIEEIAATWRIRRESRDWSARDQAELDSWLAQSTLHEVTYLRLEYGWRGMDRLAAMTPPGARQVADELPIAAAAKRPVDRRPMLLAASVAVAFVTIAAIVLTQVVDLSRKTYVTEVGEHSTVPFPDGSKVELNTDTRLRASVEQERRAVWLEQGEAYFEVAHDPTRPFVVHAGERRITVLGTKFSVRREGNDVRVIVVDGRVRVEAIEQPKPAQQTVAQRGDAVTARGASLRVTSRSIAAVENELSWRQGLLVFDQVTLEEAVAQFNRYNRKQLIIEDPAAARIPIGGRFDASNIDAFVRLIGQGLKLKISEQGDVIRISS